MDIIYIHQYFATPKGSTGTRSYEFSKRWCEAGHNVVMLTTVAQLTKEDLQNSSGRFIKRTEIDGIDVRAINLPYNQKMGLIKRGLSFLGFVFIAFLYLLFIKKPDCVYATSTPLTVGVPAMLLKLFKRVPFVFEVRDQWPEIPIGLGIIKNPMLKKLLLWLEKRTYKSSAAIVALSPGMAEGIRSVIGDVKPIATIPNSCDINKFGPDVDGSEIRDKYGWGEKFVLLHAGAMGKVNSLDFIVDAADKIREHEEIHFVLIGKGNQQQFLVDKIKELELTNLQILPPASKSDMPLFFAAADVGLVIIGDYPIIEHNSANKFFDTLSAAKPVMLNYSGWQRDVLESNHAGYGCKQYDIDEFVKKVSYLNGHRGEVLKMGIEARRIGVEKYDCQKLALEALNIIERVKFSEKG